MKFVFTSIQRVAPMMGASSIILLYRYYKYVHNGYNIIFYDDKNRLRFTQHPRRECDFIDNRGFVLIATLYRDTQISTGGGTWTGAGSFNTTKPPPPPPPKVQSDRRPLQSESAGHRFTRHRDSLCRHETPEGINVAANENINFIHFTYYYNIIIACVVGNRVHVTVNKTNTHAISASFVIIVQ